MYKMNTNLKTMEKPVLDQWIKLLPYGDYPHPRGVQHFNRSSAEIIAKNFKSLRGRLSRKFLGLPIFIGHPDDDRFSGSPGHKSHLVYGRVKDIEPRSDGMWLLIHWSGVGYQLIRNGFFRFLSPRWRMKNIGNNGFEPIKLLSVGLTNNPNIRTCRLVDHSGSKNARLSDGEKLARFITLLGLNELMDFEEQLNTLKSMVENSVKWKTQAEELIDENKKLRAEAENLYHMIQPNELQKQENESMAVNLAVDGSAPVTMDMANDRDEESLPSTNLNTKTKTIGLNSRARCFYEKKDKILALVQEHMMATGDKYSEAWAWAKRTNPSLFTD
jgi:regulator of replication initiation timing